MPQQPDNDVRLISRIRSVGPFEDWYGRSRVDSEFPRRLLVRRLLNLSEPSRKVWTDRFTSVADIADRLAHPNTVVPCGTLRLTNELALAFEYVDGIDLQTGIDQGLKLSGATSVWLIRQVFAVLRHAQSVGVDQLEIRLSTVWIRRTGDVLVDTGFPVLSLSGSRLTKGIVHNGMRLLGKLLSMQAVVGEVPREVRRLLSDTKSSLTAAEVDDELARIFYRCLEGEDDVDGRMPLQRWMAKHYRAKFDTPRPGSAIYPSDMSASELNYNSSQIRSEAGLMSPLSASRSRLPTSSSLRETIIIRFREYLAKDFPSDGLNRNQESRVYLQRFISFLIGFTLMLLMLTWLSSG